MKKILSATILGTSLLLAACADTEQPVEEDPAVEEPATEEVVPEEETTEEEAVEEDATEEETAEESVEVTMFNSDNEESGTATFTETDEGVTFEYAFTNLPEGEFAMHIHETGRATAPDFEDAGSHWNPSDVDHGSESETGPHLGDLPNIMVDSSGEVSGEETIADATLAEDAAEGQYSLHNDGQGTALIVHEGADDYVSQPTGDAGDRQLGGVIVPANENAE